MQCARRTPPDCTGQGNQTQDVRASRRVPPGIPRWVHAGGGGTARPERRLSNTGHSDRRCNVWQRVPRAEVLILVASRCTSGLDLIVLQDLINRWPVVKPLQKLDWRATGETFWSQHTRQLAPKIQDCEVARSVRDPAGRRLSASPSEILASRRCPGSTQGGPMPISWIKDVDAALAQARQQNNPLLLDFNAAPM